MPTATATTGCCLRMTTLFPPSWWIRRAGAVSGGNFLLLLLLGFRVGRVWVLVRRIPYILALMQTWELSRVRACLWSGGYPGCWCGPGFLFGYGPGWWLRGCSGCRYRCGPGTGLDADLGGGVAPGEDAGRGLRAEVPDVEAEPRLRAVGLAGLETRAVQAAKLDNGQVHAACEVHWVFRGARRFPWEEDTGRTTGNLC